MEIELKINLEDFISLDDLEDNVVRQLANTCESKLSGGHTESFHAMCVTAINQAIEGRVQERVEELLSKPIEPRDRFGNLVGGEAKSMADMIAEAADVAMTETVDRYGKPSTSSLSGKVKPRLEYLVQKVAAEGISREAENVARKVNAEAKEHAQTVLANAVAAQLARMAK